MGKDDEAPSDNTKVIHSDTLLSQELKQAQEQEACLILIRGFPQGQRYFITQEEMIVGRDPQVNIPVSEQSISRKHAKITRQKKDLFLTDLDSSNGTFVNEKKLAPYESVILIKEDIIKMGNAIFKYLPAGELETLYLGNLSSAANIDALTQLYNKAYLFQVLEVETKRSLSLNTPLTLIFFDIDFFKKINDLYGHDAGDFILREVCFFLKKNHMRDKDVFARYGGEEFVVLLLNTAQDVAMERAEQMRSAVQNMDFCYENQDIALTISCGVAQLTHHKVSFMDLLKKADAALYAAKHAGRNQVIAASLD